MVYGTHMLWAAQLLEREWRRGSAALSAPGGSGNRKIYRAPRTSGQLTALTWAAGLGDVARCSGHGLGPRVHPSGRSRKFSHKRQNEPIAGLHERCSGHVIEDHRKGSFPILVPLLRILRLTRPTAGMLRALLRLGMSKCRTQMSRVPHTSVVLTPLLQRMSVEEALIGQFS
jgi:hypothetical protein